MHMKRILASVGLIGLGFILNAITTSLVGTANAEVAGMNRYDLRYDWDFRRAVEDIVEDCRIDSFDDIRC